MARRSFEAGCGNGVHWDHIWPMAPWHGGGHRTTGVENRFFDQDKQLDQREGEMNRELRGDKWYRPLEKRSPMGTSWELLSPYEEEQVDQSVRRPVDTAVTGLRKYCMDLHLGSHVHPQDVKVSWVDGIITVRAKQDFESHEHDACPTMYQEYHRQFQMPANINMREGTSVLSPAGDLHIEAPRSQ